jgi:DNA-binding XRE family transcriptional regulator
MPRQNTSPADYPRAVLQRIEDLAQNIVIARKRRGESQAQWAKRLGVSQPTMARIERGDPSVAMASYVMCMWLINQAEGLADLIAPLKDHAALEREVTRVRTQRKPIAVGQAAPRTKTIAELQPPPPVNALAEIQNSPAARSPANNNAIGLAALLNKPGPPLK